MITSYILDPATLVSLRLVNKDWAAAADWQLDHVFLLLNMNKLTQDTIEKKRKDSRALDRVRCVIVNHPDGDYWSVSEQALSPNTIHSPEARLLTIGRDYRTTTVR